MRFLGQNTVEPRYNATDGSDVISRVTLYQGFAHNSIISSENGQRYYCSGKL